MLSVHCCLSTHVVADAVGATQAPFQPQELICQLLRVVLAWVPFQALLSAEHSCLSQVHGPALAVKDNPQPGLAPCGRTKAQPLASIQDDSGGSRLRPSF